MNKTVHGSSPCAPTIEIKELQYRMNVKGEPETPSEQRTGQHFRNFAAPVALPIARKPVGKAKRYKVTLQRLMKFTTEVYAENQREVLEIALQAVNQKGFQRQVFSQPKEQIDSLPGANRRRMASYLGSDRT
jgi:hypothetical protein